jgi:IS30 family transposase
VRNARIPFCSTCTVIGKLERPCAAEATAKTIELIERQPDRFKTITADNGTEFHRYKQINGATGVEFYFATPHNSWEPGTKEKTNGMIRQCEHRARRLAQLREALRAVAR